MRLTKHGRCGSMIAWPAIRARNTCRAEQSGGQSIERCFDLL